MPVHGRPFEKGNLYVHFKMRVVTSLLETICVNKTRSLGSSPPGAPAAEPSSEVQCEGGNMRVVLRFGQGSRLARQAWPPRSTSS